VVEQGAEWTEEGRTSKEGQTEEGWSADGDQREFVLETRVTTNGKSKSPRCFTVVH